VNGGGFTINGGGTTRILVSSGPLTTINDLSLLDGHVTGNRGGALRTNALTVSGSTFSGNSATAGGGAVDVETGNVTITNSTFSGNSATGDAGGALRVHGSATSNTTITGSTFSGNTDTFEGGAIYSDGFVHLVNSTVTKNQVTGASAFGGAISAETLTLAYTDVTDNTETTSANGQLQLRSASPTNPGVLEAFGSVLGSFPSTGATCAYTTHPPNATSASFGYNYLSDSTCFPGPSPAPVPVATDVVTTTDPGLGGLASNGGPTLTLLPGAGSAVIDRIALAACQTAPLATGVTTDQRGFTRPAGAGCDIGAVEVQLPTAVVAVPSFTG